VVLAAQLPLQLRLLLGVQFRRLDQVVEVVIEVRVDELQLGGAVLVVEGHRGPVLHGLLEVVDGDVVAEDLPGALFAGDQRRAREGQEEGPGQGRAHVEGQGIVLAAVGLVGQDDHVGPVAQEFRGLELVDQGEDVAVVAPEKLAQVRAAGGVALVALAAGDGARGLEGPGDLVVEFDPVGDHHEGPVAGHLAQDLLGEEDHGEALAGPLGLPEDPGPAVPAPAGLQRGGQGVVHPQELVVLGQDLDQAGLVLGEEGEVLHQVQQAPRVAGAPQHDLQGHPAGLVLALDALPLEEAPPVRRQGAHPAVRAVGGHQQGVIPEERRDLGLVVGQVLVEGRAGGDPGLLELDHHQGQAVHEAHQVGPAGVEGAHHGQLADQEEVVVLRRVPVHGPQAHGLLPAVLAVGHGDPQALLEEQVDLPVGRRQGHP